VSDEEKRIAVKMALGRLFRLGSRSSQPGDVKTYGDIRAVVMDTLEGAESRPEPVALILMRHQARFGH
jgi:hypothetical protein